MFPSVGILPTLLPWVGGKANPEWRKHTQGNILGIAEQSKSVIEATLKIKPPTRHTKKVEDLSSSKIMYTLKLIHNQFKNKKVKKQEQTEKNYHKITIFQKHEFSSNIKIYNPKIVVVVDHFYIALFSVLEQTSALLSHAILNSK